jgi:hypothetical protein
MRAAQFKNGYTDMDYSKGSEWRKWDLHLHGPATLPNNQFAGATPEEKWEDTLRIWKVFWLLQPLLE